MSDTQRNLPWLERLAASLPEYGGYQTSALRQASDVALRRAVSHRLASAREQLDRVRRELVKRELALDGSALERVIGHIDRVIARVESASTGVSSFYGARAFRDAKADALHAIDHGMLDAANDFLALATHGSDRDHDWLARIERELVDLEHKLDARAQIHLMAAQGDATKT